MTAADFKAAMPAFSSTDDPTIDRWLASADEEGVVDQARWGGTYNRGLANWVAYQIKHEQRLMDAASSGGSAAGLAVEKQVGSVRVKYSEKAAEAALANPFYENEYGIEYDRLAKMAGLGAVAV